MKSYYLILITIFLTSCDVVDVVPLINKNYAIVAPELEEKVEYDEQRNIFYGEDELQTYDIFLPKNQSSKVPVIILLHGGGWSEGDKGFINPIVGYLKQKNVKCAIVNANYRLTYKSGITYKQQIEDIDLIIKKLRNEAKSLNITPKFFLMGISAGGHLAMLYSYSADANKVVEVVGGIVTPSDLTSEKIRQGRMNTDIEKLIGKPFNEAPDEYRKASPAFQIRRNSPPTILFYGGSDNLVPAEQGSLMSARLKELNIKHEYYLYPEQSHNWSLLNETLDKMIAFADKYL